MYVTMQGNWTVAVKSKNAAFPQQFVISGSDSADGSYTGVVGTSVNVSGAQWTITIQNDPGGGFQASDAQIKFPRLIGTNYVFDIHSNDAGGDNDFNDLILTCSTPASILDHIIYGNVSLYEGFCLFNPCRRDGVLVIDTYESLLEALRNPKIYTCIKEYYPERIPIDPVDPELPIPEPVGPFKPIVLDLFNAATVPNTRLVYEQIEQRPTKKTAAKAKAAQAETPTYDLANFKLVETKATALRPSELQVNPGLIELADIKDRFTFNCSTEPANGITLSFEEYDRTNAERAGGPYTGTGNRQLLGDTITDMFGNYIFRYQYLDLRVVSSFPIIQFELTQPDIIVKVISKNPFEVLYESAPYYDVPNLKRINLCLPKSEIRPTSLCFNGNLIGGLGNVFIGGNQNVSASTSAAALTRDGVNNYLGSSGKISVQNTQAGFRVECAAWGGTIDMKGCMYDLEKPENQNKIEWYTIRIKRADTDEWNFVSQEYLHPRFSKRHLPNYNGDLVGPFTRSLNVDGAGAKDVPAYINIQRKTFALGEDWEFSSLDRYMRLNTSIYDNTSTEANEPGRFFVRVDGYDSAGNLVTNATDLIALYIHNKRLEFSLSSVSLDGVTPDPCNLYRINNMQLDTPMRFHFQAADPYGFVNCYELTTTRCPGTTIQLNTLPSSLTNTANMANTKITLDKECASGIRPTCSRFNGTNQKYSTSTPIEVVLTPIHGSWIRTGEVFTRYNFRLTASKRVTNGYNRGLDENYHRHADIFIQPLNP